MDIQDLMTENEKSAQQIKKWTETHSSAVMSHDASIENIQNKSINIKKAKEAGDVEKERILQEERKIWRC